MRTLAIELSGLIGSVALVDSSVDSAVESAVDTQIVAETQTDESQRSARSLIPTVKAAMLQAGWDFDSIDLIAVTAGPGSFTSLRIGVTAAKVLAWSCKAKVIGVNTLRATAMRGVDSESVSSEGEGTVHVVIDAQRKQLFAAGYQIADGIAVETEATRIVDRDGWIEGLPRGAAVSGEGLGRILERLKSERPDVLIADRSMWRPLARDVARLAIHDFANGIRHDTFALLPEYFRQSAAEEKAAADKATESMAD